MPIALRVQTSDSTSLMPCWLVIWPLVRAVRVSPWIDCSVFTATASCTAPLTLAWKKGAAALTDGGDFTGTGTLSLSIKPTSRADAGSYSLGATNACGGGAGAAEILTVLCAADFNNDGSISVQDVFDFLTAWFTGLPSADYNNAGGVTVQDVFDFLAAWFAPCP